MRYTKVKEGIFLSRPNRFIAYVMIDGREEICHVKNTGRCRELLIYGTRVFVEESDNPNRKTKYDLIAVYKGDTLVNIDSQAPNKIFSEWVQKSGYFGKISLLKPEYTYGNSRFDFYIETDCRKILVEVKGVTLEHHGVAAFPDAPTERGVKHIKELANSLTKGYEAYVFFIIQMKNVKLFVPNRATHREFADALLMAQDAGVSVKALNCNVGIGLVEAECFVDCELDGDFK